MNGANWLRINVTSASPIDASGNTDFGAKVDVLSDNSSAPPDTWLFNGDSITENDMSWQDVNAADVCCYQTDFMQSLNKAESQYYPTEFNNGIGSWPSENELTTNADTGETYWRDVLDYSGVHYLGVDYGSTNAVSGACSTYLSDEETMIAQAVNAGFQPFVRYSMTWGSGWSTSDIEYAEAIDQLTHGPEPTPATYCPASSTYLFMTYPALLVGPDFGSSPTRTRCCSRTASAAASTPHPAGENAYRQLYVQAALFNAHAG